MNLKRFTGRTSREALAQVRQAFGKDAVVMSTRNCAEGVEVLAMTPEGLQQLERRGTGGPAAGSAARRGERIDASGAGPDDAVERDVAQLAMSTLSFQDYVRERMLKRRRNEIAGQGEASAAPVVSATHRSPDQTRSRTRCSRPRRRPLA